MATYLSSYLSRPRRTSVGTTIRYPSVQRYTPYSPQNSRATQASTPYSPFYGQDFAAQLLQSKQIANMSTPSSQFDTSYNYDPIQQQIAALGSQSVANAQTNAAQLRNQAAITEGDPELLKALGFDANTITAAQGNPESLLAQLDKEYSLRQKQLADSMDAQNLYYSGEYQKQLANLASGHASAQGQLGQNLRALLSNADAGVLSAQEAARQADLQQQLQAQADASSQAALDAQGQQSNALYQALLDALNGASSDPNAGLAPNPNDPSLSPAVDLSSPSQADFLAALMLAAKTNQNVGL